MKSKKNSNVEEEFKKPFDRPKKAQKADINYSIESDSVRLEESKASEIFISNNGNYIFNCSF